MDELREKCPWDRKQTLESLRMLTLEEAYELSDAILKEDIIGIGEELGDLFLHLVFYCRMASEQGAFDAAACLEGICEKLIRRHPHIYSDTVVTDAEEVKRNWEQLKKKEGKASVLAGVPIALPALIKAIRIQEKASQVGFDWENDQQVWAKVTEEMEEFRQELEQDISLQRKEEEFGDLLFSLVNFARFKGINPEDALERVNQKFSKRFRYLEGKAGESLSRLSMEEMSRLWEEAKEETT